MAGFDFKEIVERLPLVVYVDRLDEHSSPLYVSGEIERMLGYTRDEWLAEPDLFERSLHPDDRDRVMTSIEDRNRTGTETGYADYRLIARDGRVLWIRDDEVIVPGAGSEPAVSQGYMQDVTARRRDSARMELLAHVLALAAEELPPQEIISRTADELAAALGNVDVTFVALTPERTTKPLYTTGAEGLAESLPIIPESLARLEQGPLVVEDVLDEPWLEPAREVLARRKVRSAVDIPLRRNGSLVAVMWFNTSEPRRWTPEEVQLLTEVAEQLALVLERSEAREQRLKADRIVAAVSRSAEAFFTHPNVDGAMVELMRCLGEATGASGAYVFENSPGPGDLPNSFRRAGWAVDGIKTIDDPRFSHVAPAPHWPRWAEILGAGGTLSGHVRHLPDDEREAFELIDALAVVAVPVFVDERWWGFIGFEDCERERDWSAAEIDALRAAAGLVAAAVVRDGSERALLRRDAILEAVSHAAERLVAEPRWRDAVDELLERLGTAANASRAYLFECHRRRDGKQVSTQRSEWAAAGIAPQLENPDTHGACFEEVGLARLEKALGSNELFVGNVRDLHEEERAVFESQDIRSIAIVPIFAGGNWWGFIGLDDCVAERDWSAAELDALRTTANLIAAAIGRERSEVVLREQEQKLRAVFETALDAIFITNDERRYVDVNPAGCRYMGVARDEIVGRYIDDFLPPHTLATVDADWEEYLAGGPTRAEWETQRSDGSVRIAEASAHPNFLPGLHIAFFRDVTDRKRLETELLSAQKLESLGRLAGGIAHDFNNLLTGITGYASLLLERTNGDAELARDLGEIKRAADRAAGLTKQLLAFGRRQVLKPQPLDLNAILRDVGTMLRRLVGEDVVLDLRPAAGLGTVRADPGQIEQVIVNLAVNARDAMPHGGRLTIETRNAGPDAVELVVSDTGVGMDEDTVGQIFEPFFTTREQGVGLGLASVYGILRQSGGDVAVESAPGEGSVFTIRLPRVLEPASDPEPDPVDAPASAPARCASETILLVEDEDVVRDLTRRVLERQGYTVFACADGEEAVSLAGRLDETIDLLLTDVVMPGLRGWEVARLVSQARPQMKVLYMSGYAEEALVGRASIAGNALIEKPFAVDALARRVREALETPYAAVDSPASS
jgi:PAS domain S-box-containing protein